MTSKTEQTVTYVVLGVFGLIALFPIVGIVLTALQAPRTSASFGAFDGLHFSNFADAWREGNFGSYLKSSVIVAVAVVSVAGVLSIMSGYAFGLMRFRGSTVLFYVFLLGLMVPVEAMVVPLYFDFRDVHVFGWSTGIELLDTYWALILPQIGQSVAFGTFWMRAFFRSVPRSLIEAARIDGATSFGVLWRVLLPQAMPAVLTLCVLVFTYTWNEFLLALVLVSSEDRRTAPLGLAFFQGQHTSDYTLLAAASVIVATPVVIVYVFLQRHFIRGMLTGAVKG
jgi:raffinose/stachyose/melibiose transport system permease protein